MDIGSKLAYYTIVGPSGNLYDDSLAGEIAIAPLRALDTPWQAGICEPGETPRRDPDGLCAAYLASLNPWWSPGRAVQQLWLRAIKSKEWSQGKSWNRPGWRAVCLR